jgi:transposase
MMLSRTRATRVWVATASVDMRKGFDGLAALVEASGLDLYSGHLFVFLSRRRDRVKVLVWERGGLGLYYKRLEKGRFSRLEVQPGERMLNIEPVELAMLLDGVDLGAVRRTRMWEPPKSSAEVR